ncbi:tetratricopeptide repeat protein [Phenylobacterium sp. 20VBR1]|uniref:Tetratricopeptide repeat protein n=2 Tax=Phenylobacterium glaciei TaxID=2803784 RepID=A0A941HYP1_9CAUL|nr:tetratricopeptide repeat protein [Phenylobacterium glaciei]MBR7621602.1 tetratricopeptide repeat protein [Phenylobacterium glaciei]
MCRMSALAATALTLSLACAVPASAKAAKPAPVATPAAATPAAPEGLRRATAEERSLAARLDPLARAAFWGREADIDPRDAEAGVGLAQALRAMGKYDDAAQAAQRVLVTAPKNVEALLEVARAQVARGQGFYAIEPARQAQELAPRDWRAPSLLGVAYDQASRPEEALAAHSLAASLAPENPVVLCNLALFYASHGDAPRAEALLRSAAAKPGAPMAVRQNLALVLGLKGRFDEAEKLVRQDLPPEAVANNMAFLRAAAPGPAGPPRSWDSVRTAQ